MNWVKALVIIALLIVPMFGATAASNNIPTFSIEAQAQHHCPGDTVVWLDTRNDSYQMSGSRWYGKTQNGAFACQKDADRVGIRPELIGQ
jgi:hypothetical protein